MSIFRHRLHQQLDDIPPVPDVPEVADRADEINELRVEFVRAQARGWRSILRTDEVVRANNHAKHFREALEARP